MRAISVIIPTVGRDSVLKAVQSVNSQVGVNVETIVVLDAPSKADFVKSLLASEPHVLLVNNRLGAAAARNRGLDAAKHDYVSFLDDDDEWLSDKALKQIVSIEKSEEPTRTVSVAGCYFVRRDRQDLFVEPRSFDPRAETLLDHIVARRNFRYIPTYFNTPALVCSTALMRSVRWEETLRKHQDWDLYARLSCNRDVHFITVAQPLVRVAQGSAGSISMISDWRHGEKWFERHRALLSPRVRADFLLLHVLLHAVRQRSREGIAYSARQWPFAFPHLGAAGRFVVGLLMNR